MSSRTSTSTSRSSVPRSSSSRGSRTGGSARSNGFRLRREVPAVETQKHKDDIPKIVDDDEQTICFQVLLEQGYFSGVSENIIEEYGGIRGVFDTYVEVRGREGDLVILDAKTRTLSDHNRDDVSRWTPGIKKIYRSVPIKGLEAIHGVIIDIKNAVLIYCGRGYTETLIIPGPTYNGPFRVTIGENTAAYGNVDVDAAECNYSNLDNIASGNIDRVETQTLHFGTDEARFFDNLGGMLVNVFIYGEGDDKQIYMSNGSRINIFAPDAKWNGVQHSNIMKKFGITVENMAEIFYPLFRDPNNKNKVYSFYVTDVHYAHRSKMYTHNITTDDKGVPKEDYPPFIYPRYFYLSDITEGRASLMTFGTAAIMKIGVLSEMTSIVADLDKENLCHFDLVYDLKRTPSDDPSVFPNRLAQHVHTAFFDNVWMTIIDRRLMEDGTYRNFTINVCTLKGLDDYNSWHEKVLDSLAIRLAEQARKQKEGGIELLNTALNETSSVFGVTKNILMTQGTTKTNGEIIKYYDISANVRDWMLREHRDGKPMSLNGKRIVMNRPWDLQVVRTISEDEWIAQDRAQDMAVKAKSGINTPYDEAAAQQRINRILLSNAFVRTVHANVHPEVHHVAVADLLSGYNRLVQGFLKIFDQTILKLRVFAASRGKGKKGILNSAWLGKWIVDNEYSLELNNRNYLVKSLLDCIHRMLLNDERPDVREYAKVIHYPGVRTDSQRNAIIESQMYRYISPVDVSKIGRHQSKDSGASVQKFLGLLHPYITHETNKEKAKDILA